MPINGSGGAQVTAPGSGTYTIRVWLVDQAGRGSAANATTTAVTVPAPTAAPPPPRAGKPTPKKPTLKVRTLTWRHGILTLTVTGLAKHAKLHIDPEYAHRHLRRLIIAHERLRLHTTRPRLVVLRVFNGKRQDGNTITTHLR